MHATQRPFDPQSDFTAITEFLGSLYEPGNRDGNWFWPIWEYAYTHAWCDRDSFDRIGIWEADGRIVAVVTYEMHLGEAFINVHPDYLHLRPDMLEHAEQHLVKQHDDGHRSLSLFVPDMDEPFERLAASRGYTKAEHGHRPMSVFDIPSPFPSIQLPDGFRLQSLADENDLVKLDRCLHRGFNHVGEPPADGVEGRKLMQSGPNFRYDINIVAVAPSGEYVSFGGMWYDHINKIAYVEPVATDPDYRRRGLGRAAVLESIRRCGELGATVAYVGTDMPFYLSFGFKTLFTYARWHCTWEA